MIKKALTFIILICIATYTHAMDVKIIHECDTTWNFGYMGVNLYARDMHRIDIAYPSVDAKGTSVTLSGSIVIPRNIYDGGDPVDGVVLYNRYIQMTPNCVPTRGYAEGEYVFMATPLEPNWILVESDFYGFGISSEHLADQYYIYGDANGHASIDCLLAAREVLDSRNISQGKFLLNVGYSTGGYDAIATQRVRDMYHRDDISFDKTIAGGAPYDVAQAYSEYIEHKDDTTQQSVFALTVINTLNRMDQLGFTHQQLFTEPLASKFDNWFSSGKYSRHAIRDSLKKIGNRFSQFVQPPFLDENSDEYKTIKEAIAKHNLSKNWQPDRSQRYYYQHYTRDNAVPVSSGRAFLKFLTRKGYKKSVVPELTNLQTCMYVISNKHTLGGVHFMLHVAATLSAYPLLYYDGELNTHYYDLIKVGTPMGIIKLLEEKGYDFSGIVDQIGIEDHIDLLSLLVALNVLNKTFEEWGTNSNELVQIAEDSGLELSEMVKIINYLKDITAKDDNAQTSRSHTNRSRIQEESEVLICDHFYNYLYNWLQDNHIDIESIE